ncbi:MAG: chorismate-binding protein [Coriobacteriia bacterium]
MRLGSLDVAGPLGSPGLTPAALGALLAPEKLPLVLAPSGPRGWFGGIALACWEPCAVHTGLAADRAADLLDNVMRRHGPLLAAAVLPYDGPAEVRVYGGGWVLGAEGWRAWGDAEALPAPGAAPASADGPLLTGSTADLDESAYTAAVRETQERITAGDVYVLNLTYRVSGTATAAASTAFGALLARAAAPMAALWGAPERSLASASPERFCRLERSSGGLWSACIEPIKGTRPRHADAAEDARLARELAADEKEHAEHIMIVDLERNDLGRAAVPGSVRVDPLLEVFGTPYCHQLASSVRAVLRPDASLADLVSSVFPCGSVTGAPKRAAMRIIGELEGSARGAYTGSLLVAVPGALDSSVLIRTLEYTHAAHARWGTGCGITIDSDPAAEWQETLLKAGPLLGRR